MRIRTTLAALAVAGITAVLPVTAAGAAPGPAGDQVTITASCAEIQAEIAALEERLLILQAQLRRAAPQDKPRIIRQIVAVQARIEELTGQLSTCS